MDIENRRIESVAKLREAIINLREARQRSCTFRAGPDCHLADLSSFDLKLLNIEDDYRRVEFRGQDDSRRKQYKQIYESANELRGKVGELEDLINKAGQ